jgi:nitrite reductase/ring-hydroxylating ferredoxin subunit
MTEPQPPQRLLDIGMSPPTGWYADGPGDWRPLPELGPPTRRPVRVELDGVPVLVCSLRGTLYAYRDSCAACGGSLAGSTLDDEVLTCAACGCRFDVRLAGRGVHGTEQHLDPLPLVSDSQGVRVAVAS